VPGQAVNQVVLAAVGFVGDDDDVATVAQPGHLLALVGQEFLDGGEHHATARHCQQLAQALAAFGLHGRLAKDVVAALELAEKLVVQVVAVGQHHQRRVLHGRVPHHPRGVEEHREALATALRMPDHARATVAGLSTVHPSRPGHAQIVTEPWPVLHAAGADGFLHRHVHRMELVIARDDLVQLAAVGIFLEDDEVFEQVQKTPPVEHPTHHHLKLQRRLGCIALAVNGSPDLEPFLVGRQGADACLQAIARHQHGVVVEQGRDLRLVGAELLVGSPDRRILIGGILQLDEAKRQAVHEHDDIRPTVVLAFDDRVLVQRQPVVRAGIVEIHQTHVAARDGAVGPWVFHFHAIAEHLVKSAVGLRERRHPQIN
jgi:hypothetical protein